MTFNIGEKLNLCILFYPEDGDQAWVDFVDFKLLSGSTNADDIIIYNAAQTALNSPDFSSSIPYPDEPRVRSPFNLTLPCQIDCEITIYLET
jgi:hypothetical protein